MRQEEECEGVMDSVYVCCHFSLNLCSCLFVCFFLFFFFGDVGRRDGDVGQSVAPSLWSRLKYLRSCCEGLNDGSTNGCQSLTTQPQSKISLLKT